MKSPFAPRHAVLLAALAAIYPVAGYGASAARIDFASGRVEAVASDGARRALARGSELMSGDTVFTHNGRAQMRFSDGAMVSLKPESEFRIDDYRYNGKPDGEERGFFSLLKGGLRTITGWIGRDDRKKYQVNTVVATIGIRGTEYAITYGNSINVNTGEGIVEVCNDGGCLLLYPGDEGYVKDEGSKPVLVQTGEERPKKDNTPPELTDLEGPANERDGSGKTTAFGGLLTGTKNFRVAWANTDSSGLFAQSGLSNTGQPGTINAAGTLINFESGNFASGTSSTQSLGNNGVVAWGQWIGPSPGDMTVFGTLAEGILHYAGGLPTQVSDPGLPPSATFSLLGGSVSGTSSGLGSVTSGSMSVTFGSAVTSLNIGLSVGANSYTIAGAGYNLPPSGDLTFADSATTVTGGSCTGCTAFINGSLFGSGASAAGVSFDFFDAESISGAAAFAKN